ncbi:T-cell surface glycoprotein CD1a isoform X4 [Mustela putorius furo]|uniref:T-cell surface glycoprotein CD1a isoform X4 n=1 Tax=Mustela putorius furo TaxID=9669 RepID=A0A8U0NKY1_MUSPF|nr:T-cell surface glycoprotein CD1a isoform X4 [Mustela putorius furo]
MSICDHLRSESPPNTWGGKVPAFFLSESTPNPRAVCSSEGWEGNLGLWSTTCLLGQLWLLCDLDFCSPPWHLLHSLSFPVPSLSKSIFTFATAVQEPISFQITLTVSFYNRSWTQSLGSAWLDEIQTHGWDNKTGAFIFLWPWSKGNWSNAELIKLEKLLYAYFIGLRQVFQDHVRHWHLEYPFQIQLAEGCELHFGEASVGFVKFAYQGADLTSFQNTTWWPSPKGGSRAQEVCKRFNQYHVLNEEIHTLFSDTCPKFLLGLLDAGKADLQRQVRPEAWLSTGPSPGPGRLLLICHVSGFYPKPVLVMWMHEQPHSKGLVFLAVMVPLVLLAGLTLWLWKCWKTQWRHQCTGFSLE